MARVRLMHQKVERGVTHAEAALDAYRAAMIADPEAGRPDPDDEGAIGDLIVDLLHLAERRGVLPSGIPDVIDLALLHYQHESDPDNSMEEV